MTSDIPGPTFQDYLRGRPLYEGCGEESDLPEQAATALHAAQAQLADLSERYAERSDALVAATKEVAALAEAATAVFSCRRLNWANGADWDAGYLRLWSMHIEQL